MHTMSLTCLYENGLNLVQSIKIWPLEKTWLGFITLGESCLKVSCLKDVYKTTGELFGSYWVCIVDSASVWIVFWQRYHIVEKLTSCYCLRTMPKSQILVQILLELATFLPLLYACLPTTEWICDVPANGLWLWKSHRGPILLSWMWPEAQQPVFTSERRAFLQQWWLLDPELSAVSLFGEAPDCSSRDRKERIWDILICE